MGDKKVSVLMLGIVGLVGAAMPAGPARAASGTPCAFELEIVVAPGLTTSPSSGTVTSEGEKGTINCDGPVNGQQPTGPGTVGFDGRYGTEKAFSCREDGNGAGAFALTIPRAGGSEHVTSTATYEHGAYSGGRLLGGTFRSDRFSGTFEARPVEGDCVSTPMTRFRITGQGTLT